MLKCPVHGRIFSMIRYSLKTSIKGQTLVEVFITLLFVAVSVIALIRFQSYLAYDNNLSQQKSIATMLARNKIEQLRDFQVLANTAGYTSYQSIVTGSSTQTVTNTSYTISWTITANTNPTYKLINVNVAWTDRYSGAQSVRLVTNIAGIEPQYSAIII